MLEKLLLASILTFSFSLIAEMGWTSSKKEITQVPTSHQEVLTLTQLYKSIESKPNQ
jgi:hypothetical protein